MELDDIKKQWSEMNERINRIDNTLRLQSLEKKRTALDWIAHKYLMLAIIAPCVGILTTTMAIDLFGSWLTAGFVAFFLIAGGMDIYLYRMVKRINPLTMSVSEVSDMARRCRRRHHQFQLALIPLALALIGTLAFQNVNDQAALIGMAAGGAVGVMLGGVLYLRLMRRYRTLIDN